MPVWALKCRFWFFVWCFFLYRFWCLSVSLGLKCQFWDLKCRFGHDEGLIWPKSKITRTHSPKRALNNSSGFVVSAVPFCIVVVTVIVVVCFMWMFVFALPLCFVVIWSYVWMSFVIVTVHCWLPTTNICPIEMSRKFSKYLAVFKPTPRWQRPSPMVCLQIHGVYKTKFSKPNLSQNIFKKVGCQIVLKMNVLHRSTIAKHCQPNAATYMFGSKQSYQSCSCKPGSVPTV